MKKKDLETLKSVLKLKQNDLQKAMYYFLKKFYKNVIYTNNYLLAFGDIPIALVAHMDTVHPTIPREIFLDQEKEVMWSPQGLGADDRAGVYAIIAIVKRGLRPNIILTTDEEIGGLGAAALIRSFEKSPFSGQLKFIIELDRAHKNDCVFYNCDNKDFVDYISSFGFVFEYGTFTDISIIAPKWKVAAVNLSVGYYQEHSLGEHLVLPQLEETINKVIEILVDEDSKYYEYVDNRQRMINQYDCTCLMCQKNLKPMEGFIVTFGQFSYTTCEDCYDDLIF